MLTLSEDAGEGILHAFTECKADFGSQPFAQPPRVVLTYPVLNQGASADPVAPHSLYYIKAMLTALDVPAQIWFWDLRGNDLDVPDGKPKGDIYYIHPMFATIESCCKMIPLLRKSSPGSLIGMGNSDQHQHEMCIGGCRELEIAHHLLDAVAALDFILLGKNHEYAVARLAVNWMKGLPLDYHMGRGVYRTGDERVYHAGERIFTLDSLPFFQPLDGDPQMVRVRSSVGCRAVCRYCIESGVNKSASQQTRWIGMSPVQFVEQLSRVFLLGLDSLW